MARVLVVDDEEDIRLLARLVLEADDHEVIEAADGQSALDHLAGEPIDLIMLDIRMAGMSGWDVIDELVARGSMPTLPVLIFSAHVEPGLLATALGRGCAGVLAKPFTTDECLDAVRQALTYPATP